MSGRRSKKNQRLGSSRRGPKGLNRNVEKDDDDDGFPQIAESEDGRNEFHTSTDYHSTKFDHPPSSSINQQTSALESLPHASHMETELPERKRKMGSTRKSTGKFKDGRKLDEVRTTEELDEEYVTQPNTSTTEEQHEEEQSRPMSFPSDLSHSSGLGKEPGTALMFAVSENEEKAAIHHQEITSHSHEVVTDMSLDEAMGTSIHSFAVTAESDLLREESVMFDEPKTLEVPIASGPKRRMGSTRRPLRGKNSEKQENVGVQEHSTNMTKNERKAEVMSEEMAQTWDDVARDDLSSHAESSLVLNQSLLAERAELKEPDISAGTETMNQSVAFPLVDSEKPLPETSSHNGTPLLNEGLDFKFASHTEGFDVLNKVLKDAGSHLSDNSHVPDTRKDTNTSCDFRDLNTESKEEVLKQKEELSINDQVRSLLPKQDGQLEELALNDQESLLSQHDIATLDNNCDSAMPQLLVGGSRSFDVPLSNISHDEPTTTNLPHEMSDAVEERLEIHIEKEQGNNFCNGASVTCNTLTDLESIMEEHENPQILATRENENVSDERGSETENAFEMTDQDDARDHSVTQIIMDVRDNEKDGETRTEAIWISHQKPSEVSAEKEELYKGQVQCSLNIYQKYSPPQDDAGKMLENDEVTQDKKETENTAANVTSKSEEMFSFEDSATDTGCHAHQLLMQSPDEEDYDLHENVNEKSEKEEIRFSVESENADFVRGDGRSEGTEGMKELDAAPVVILDVDTNDSESENPEQNRVLTEEQTDTNLQVLEVSENVSTLIDSALLLHDVAVGSLGKESHISSFIPEDSQDSYKPTAFHPESQENAGDAERAAVGGDTDLHLEIEAQNKKFDSTTRVAEGTEEYIHDASVLVREVEVIGNTVAVESNMTTELDLLQTSPDAHVETLKVSVNAEKDVLGETDTFLKHSDRIIPADSHGEEAHSKSSPVIHKRKMGSTRRPLKGKKGQRKEHDEKDIFSLDDEPSPDEPEEVKIREVDVISDTVTMGSNMTTELDFHQTSPDANMEALKVSENPEILNVGSSDTIGNSHSEIQPENKMIFLTSKAERTEDTICEASFSVIEDEFIVDTVITESNMTIESETLTKIYELQEHTGDATRNHLEIKAQNKIFDSTSEAEEKENNIHDASVLVREVEVIGDTDTMQINMTTESDFLQTSPDAHVEALNLSENAETEVSGETDTILKQSDMSIIPEDSHGEEAHSKSSPVIHKRKMGSTHRPLKGNKGQRKEIEHLDKNETPDSEGMIKVENETIKLEGKPSPYEYTLQSLKYGAKEQVEICQENDVGPVEGSESAFLQSSCSSDLVSEESTAISICHITETQTLTKINEESQENTGDDERVPAEEDKDLQLKIDPQNQTFDLTTSKAEGTEENIQDVSVTLVREVEVVGDTVTVKSNLTTESDFPQTSPDAHTEALKVSENAEKEVSGKTETVSEQSDISIIPADSHREETRSKSSPVIHKRKMGSTRRPLKGNNGRRKDHDEKEIFILEDEPSPDESTLQSLKDGAKEQMEICWKNDVGPVEGPESADLQSSCSSDLASEKSDAVNICHFTESQTLTKINEESQENAGDDERVPADLQLKIDSQNKTFDSTTSEAEGTEENIQDVIGDTVIVESNVTTESDFLQTSLDAHMEALNLSENAETEVSGETETILKQSDIRIIPEDTNREEAHSKSSPVIYKRKMGSTRRPLKGNKGQRKETEHHDENEPPDSEGMINVEKETFSLEDEHCPDESTLQSLKDGAKEQEMEICKKNDVGPVEGSESALLQSSCISDLVSEESTAISICHITKSQTLIKLNEESQENTGDVERVPAEEDKDLELTIGSQNKTFDSTTSEAEGTEENIQDVSVTLVKEVEVIGDTVTVESNMTTESDFLQTSPDAHIKALKVSGNTEKEVSGEPETIPEQSDMSIIPADSHREETHAKSSPVIHKRIMGSTRRPLKGNTGRRKDHDEKEILEDEPSPDQSGYTAVSICDISESQTLRQINAGSQENTGDAERVPAEEDKDFQLKIDSQNKRFDLTTSEPEGTDQNIQEVSVMLVREVKFIGDTVSADNNMTTESDLIQNDTSFEAKLEASINAEHEDLEETDAILKQSDTTIIPEDPQRETLKVPENAEKEVSGETDTILKQSDINIVPEDTHEEKAHSKSSPFVHKRKMGSTRRPLRGNKGQRKETEHQDENEPLDNDGMINVEKETISLENEPSPYESTLQILKDGAKEQEMEICEKNDVGPVEGSKSALLQSSCSSDLVSEESTAISICHITESQTLTKINEESQENAGDAEREAVRGDADLHLEIEAQNKTSNSTTSEAEGTEENKQDASVLVREVEVISDMVTMESNVTTEFDFLQTSPDADRALKSENTEKEVSGERDTILEQSDIRIIPTHSHGEEAHSKSSPIVHKRKMGSTRRPLKEKKGQRQKRDEKEIFNLEDEPSPDESTLQSSKDEAKGHEMGICEKNDVDPTERSKSADLRSSCSSDLVSEESNAISICHVTESQTLTKINEESQENAGDVKSMPADLQLKTDSQNKTFYLTSEAEETVENIQDISVMLVREVEGTGDTVTVESSMTTESDFLQTSPDSHVEALKISEIAEKEVSGKTDTNPKQSDMSIIPADSHREETHAKSSPVIHKRKMGSTRRPLKGNKGQRKDHDEKEIFILEDEPSRDESRHTAVSDISESLTLTKIHAGSQENTGDVEIVPVGGDTESHLENKTFDSTAFEGEATKEQICEPSVLVKDVKFSGDAVTVERNITTESDSIQNNTLSEAKLEALKVSDSAECEVLEDIHLKQSDTTIIPEDTQKEEAHPKLHPVVHKRKMGSTRRPLKGQKGERKEIERDENETLDSEGGINAEKDTFCLEDEPSPDETTIHSTKDGVKEQIEICEKNDVGPVEGSESALLQPSCSSNLVSEKSTAISICHITESQTLTKMNEESQENAVAAEENKDIQLRIDSQNKTFDSTTSETEVTEENIQDISVTLVREVEVIGDTATVESNMTTDSDFETCPDAHIEALKVSEKEVSGETDTILKQSDISIISEDSHREETHSKSSPVIHKRKMGSTRRPLKGNKGRRKDHDEKEIFNLDDEPSPDESGYTVVSDISESQTHTKIHAGSQESIGDVEIAPAEGDTEPHLDNKTFDSTAFKEEVTEEHLCEASALVKEVEFIGDTVIVESNMTTESDSSEAKLEALKVSDSAEHEVLEETDTIPRQSDTTIMPEDTQKEEAHSKLHPIVQKIKMGSTRRPLRGNKDDDEKEEKYYDIERALGGRDTDPHSEIQTENTTLNSATFEREGTEETICEASDTSFDAKPDALIFEMAENEISGKTDTIPKQSDTNIISEGPPKEELHTKLSLNVHKRKMGSTRRPLRGNKGQRKVGVESKEKNGDSEGLSEEEDTETQSEIQNRDNVVDHNVTQEIMNIRDNEDEERNITKTVDMSVQELCDDLELEQRSDVSLTQTGPSQDDTVSHALLMEETQIYVLYDDVPPTEVAEMLPVSTMSVQKRKMGSSRKRGKRMVNEEEVEKGKEGEDENTTTDDGTTKSEEKLPVEEAISGSPEHQQLCSSSVNKEQNDPNSTINLELLIESKCTSKAAAEMVSDLPLGDVDTYLDPKQNVIPKESHREDQSNLNPVVQKRKMGSTRKTLRSNKRQGREGESKIMDTGEEMTHEHDTEPRLATSAGKTESKFDEKVEQNFLVAASNMFPESENEVKEVSQNIHDLPEVSGEKGMEHTGNDSNSVNEAINLYDGTKDKFVLTVSHEDVPQTMPTDGLDQHVGSEPEQTENTHQVIPTQELKNTEDDVVHEITSQKIPATQEKRRKMGSTRRMHGKNMADNEDMLGKAEDGETKTAEDDLDDLPLASCISQSKEMSSVSTTDLESENENDHQNSSEPSGPTVPENTLQICANQLVNADVTKHPQSETVSTEKRRKMGSTRKNLREGRLRGKRDGYEDTETSDSEMSLVREDVGDQTTHDYSNQSEISLLSEIESALNKTSQNSLSCDWELIVKEPSPDDLANAPVLNMPENSEIRSLQPTPSAHSEPNSPGRRRRKMGSTRKNPRQELKAERDDADKEDGEIDENFKTNKQEKKDLEVHNITENKEYLDVSSAHTDSSQLEESTNPVSQEGTSPSTKRKFGSRRANKGKQGLGSLAASDLGNELEDGDHKPDKLHNEDLAVCDPPSTLQPENQPISHPVSEQRNMEAKNEEAAPKGTGAGLVSLDQIMKPDRSTRAKQTVNLKNRISDAEVVQFNIVMVGNSCVGKTSFVRRFHEGQFTEDYRSTIGVDTCVQTIALPDKIVKLQIWDTAGQERFHSITTQVFRKADGLLFMYEITSSNSFTSVRDWISQAQEKAPDDAIMMLLGNKNDSVERKVQIQEGADLAREYNIHFMECSAATGTNVSESMRTLAELLAQRKSEKEKHTTLRREPPQKKSGCC